MHWLLTDKGFAKEIRLFGIGSIFRDRYVALRQQLREEKLDISVNRSKANLLARAIEVVAIFGSLAFLALEGLKGNITIGDVTMYFGALTQGQAVIGSILSSLTGLYCLQKNEYSKLSQVALQKSPPFSETFCPSRL